MPQSTKAVLTLVPSPESEPTFEKTAPPPLKRLKALSMLKVTEPDPLPSYPWFVAVRFCADDGQKKPAQLEPWLPPAAELQSGSDATEGMKKMLDPLSIKLLESALPLNAGKVVLNVPALGSAGKTVTPWGTLLASVPIPKISV